MTDKLTAEDNRQIKPLKEAQKLCVTGEKNMDKISFRKANEERNWNAFDQCHCDSLCCGCAHKNECRCSDYIEFDDYDSNRSDEVISRCAYFTTELTKE